MKLNKENIQEMFQKHFFPIIIGFVAFVFLLMQSIFIVQQTQTAIVLQLGEPVGDAVLKPGMHFKIPFIQKVLKFDARILNSDSKPAEILSEDKKTMVVDSYTKWQITNPLDFYRALRTIPQAQHRIDSTVYEKMREVLGSYPLIEIVAEKRQEIMQTVTEDTNNEFKKYGVHIIDVRIKRADLPTENEQAVFGRMIAERIRVAKQYRAEGIEAAARIRATADKERIRIISEAKKNAEILRGQGEATAAGIYAEAVGRNPQFFAFLRSMDAYKKSLKNNTELILTPSMPFFEYFRKGTSR